jgi:hypothetical protein
VELSPEDADADLSIRYLCRTPSPVSGIDMVDNSRDLARRVLKQIEKRNAQRMAIKTSLMFASSEGKSSAQGSSTSNSNVLLITNIKIL